MNRPIQTIVRVSPFSGERNTMQIKVDLDDIARWRSGELIQNALGYLSADEREFIKTGITPTEWNDTFKD